MKMRMKCGRESLSAFIAALLGILLGLCSAAMAQHPNVLMDQADEMLAKGQYGRARTYYEQALASGLEFGHDPVHARNLAVTYLSSSKPVDLSKAVRWLRIAIEIPGGDSESSRALLAGALLRMGDAQGAIEQFRQLLAMQPQNADYIVGMAEAQGKSGGPAARLELLEKSIAEHPQLNGVRVEYARQLNFAGRFEKAKQEFQRALQYDPDNLIAQVGLAKATSFSGDQKLATEMYDRILRRNPRLYDAKVGKAFSLLWSGRAPEARKLLLEAAQRHPDDMEVRTALAGLQSRTQPSITERNRNRATPAPSATSKDTLRPALSLAQNSAQNQASGNTKNSAWSTTVPMSMFVMCLIGALGLLGFSYRMRHAGTSFVSEGGMLDSLLRNREMIGSHSSGQDREKSSVQRIGVTAPHLHGVATDSSGKDLMVRKSQQVHRAVVIGGSPGLIELQRRWLAAREDADIMPEFFPEWIAGLARILSSDPALVVLNPTTEDHWTSLRMYRWLLQNQPELTGRVVAIISAGHSHDDLRVRNSAGVLLCEPFSVEDWQKSLQTALLRSTTAAQCASACHILSGTRVSASTPTAQ